MKHDAPALIDVDQLDDVIPNALAVIYCAPLEQAMWEFGIASEARIEMFLAQIAHESGLFQFTSEGLNYSAEALANTWPSRYAAKDELGRYIYKKGRKTPNDLALRLHRQPEAIANNVYANRMGNGPEESGDGWTHRGAGLIQLTGKTNQAACAAYFGIALGSVGDWLRSPVGACRSAAWFWHRAKCNEAADRGDFDAVSDRINIGRDTDAHGDAIGFEHRAQLWELTKRAIPSPAPLEN